MPIISNNPSGQTREQRLAADVTAIRGQINGQYRQLAGLLNRAGNLVWANADNTPEEVVAAFGADATELFRLCGILVNTLSQVTNTTVPNPMPSNYTATPNADGTVTLAKVQS